MYESFFLPNESGVRIYGYEDMTNPNVKRHWSLGEKIVFNQQYKKWLKNLRESRKRLIGMPVIEDNAEEIHNSDEPLSSNEWAMYARLSHDEGRGRLLNEEQKKTLEEFKERIQRTKSNGRSG